MYEGKMDQKSLNQLQFYTPPQILNELFKNPKNKYAAARHIIDREYKTRPQKWKTIAFPEYEDFFQAATAGYNPYKAQGNSKDKGVLPAIENYNPHKNDNGLLKITVLNNIEQATCPLCELRGSTVSLWPHSAGNTLDSELAPEPIFYRNDKYCGFEVLDCTPSQAESWIEQGLIRKSGERYFCNYKNRIASLKNYISSQVNFLIQDIKTAEYHSSRTIKKHPFYTCTSCNTLVPNTQASPSKVENLTCSCGTTFPIRVNGKKVSEAVWQARSYTGQISLSDNPSETDSRSYENIIAAYGTNHNTDDPVVQNNLIQFEKNSLFEKLLHRVRELAASNLSSKQLEKLLKDPTTVVVNGVPETQNFQIFYNYFFMDNLTSKKDHKGKTKNSSDESSTYRELALRFLKKEQHYTKCSACSHKMYEPTESAKFKKLGARTSCEQCNSLKVVYHGPHCGCPGSLRPSCKEHGDTEVVMYIFQTIEPKMRRLEELIKKDAVAKEFYQRIDELIRIESELHNQQEMVKLLNY